MGCTCLYSYQLCRRVPAHVIFISCLPDMTLDRTVGNQAQIFCIRHGTCTETVGDKGVINVKGLNNQKLTLIRSLCCKKMTRDCRKIKIVQILRKGTVWLKTSMHCLKILPHFLPFNIKILPKVNPTTVCTPWSQNPA